MLTLTAEQGVADTRTKRATLTRMVMPDHVCPYGLKSLRLLRSKRFEVDDHWLETREATDAYKAEHHVKTTPQTFVGGERVGGYDDLRRFFGQHVPDPKATTYAPIIALFSVTALMALAATYFTQGTVLTWLSLQWFIAFSMCVLAFQKVRNVKSFFHHVSGLRPPGPALGDVWLHLPLC